MLMVGIFTPICICLAKRASSGKSMISLSLRSISPFFLPRISPSRTWKLASRRAQSSPPTRLPWSVSPILSRGSGRPRALAHQSEVLAQGAVADEAEAVVFAEIFDLDDDGHEIRRKVKGSRRKHGVGCARIFWFR